MPNMVVDRVKENDRINRGQRSGLPLCRHGYDFIGDIGNRGRRYFYAINIFDVFLNITDGHPLGVHRDDLLIKFTDIALTFLNDGWFKGARPVPRCLYLDFTIIGSNGFCCFPVAAVSAVVPLCWMFLITQMVGHLRFKDLFCHLLEHPF